MIKRILPLFLIAVFLFGCSQQTKNSDVFFYYPSTEYDYNTDDGVISYEVRSKEGLSSSARLLNLYLKGPVNETLQNPFPEDVTVISVYTQGDTVCVTLSDSLAKLSGAPLILSCACIARTAMELTKTHSAEIRCESLLLDGKKTIIINDSTVFFSDTFPQTEPEVP